MGLASSPRQDVVDWDLNPSSPAANSVFLCDSALRGVPLTTELSPCTEPSVAPSSETYNLRHGKAAFVRSGEGGDWRRGCWLERLRRH